MRRHRFTDRGWIHAFIGLVIISSHPFCNSFKLTCTNFEAKILSQNTLLSL